MRALVAAIAALAFASPALAGANLVVGKTVFESKCGSCHTLAAAGTHSTNSSPGPALTNLHVSATRVTSEIYGAGSGMPLMAPDLTQQQITDVVAYVVEATKPPPKKKT